MQHDSHTNYVIAAIALVSPWWLPLLENISWGAGQIVPVLIAIWFCLQIGFKLYDRWMGRVGGKDSD